MEIRREAVLLLGSLLSLKRAREYMNDFSGLSKMLFDENVLAREACGWAICRLISGRDGVDILCPNMGKALIESFLIYSN